MPYDRVRDAGHEPVIAGLEAGKQVTGKHGAPVTIERGIDEVSAEEFDAGWMLAEADIVGGKTVTSYPSIKTDLPGDLPAFCEALLRRRK